MKSLANEHDFQSLLTSENRCVLFECSQETDPEGCLTGKWLKFPRNGFTRKPYHNESDLYSYAVCAESARRYYKGLVGVRTGQLSNGLHLNCFDFDKQRNQETGEWNDCVKNAAKYFNSYTEESVSGLGCHIFTLSDRPYLDHVGQIDHKFGEVYWAGQSIAMTGNLVSFDDWKSPGFVRLATDKVIAWCEKVGTFNPHTQA